VTVVVAVVVVEKLSPLLHVSDIKDTSSGSNAFFTGTFGSNAFFMGTFGGSTAGNWVFICGLKVGICCSLEMGVSERTSFTYSSSRGRGFLILQFCSRDPRWGCLGSFWGWLELGVLKQQPI